MATLAVEVPDEMLAQFRALADKEFRSPEGQVLWLIRTALDAAERRAPRPASEGAQARLADHEQRIRAAQPLFEQLRTTHLLAGGPSSRALAKSIWEKSHTRMSHTTVNAALNGTAFPSWRVLESIVKVLDGDVEHFRRLWADSKAG